jgi:hypothetical protein
MKTPRTPSHPCSTPIGIVGLYIPDSPPNVIDAGLIANHPSGWFGDLRFFSIVPS